MSKEIDWTEPVSSTIWDLENSKIFQEKWRLTKYYVLRNSKLIAIQIMIDVSMILQRMNRYFDKKDGQTGTVNISEDQQFADELHEPITRKLQRWKVCSFYQDNIWVSDLAGMQSLSKFNKVVGFLLYITNIYNNHTSVVLLKDKKGIIITNVFQNPFDDCGCHQNKICLDQISEFITDQ